MGATHTRGPLDRLTQPTLDLLPAAAFLTSVPAGAILHCNQRAADLCGGAIATLENRPLPDLLRGVAPDGSRLPMDLDPVAAALQRGLAIDGADAEIDAGSRRIAVSVSINPVIADDGARVALTLCQPTDQALRDRTATLLAADRRKDEFLAVLAHELRNPLAPILAAARILELKGPPDPALQRARAAIIRQTLQLTNLVEDLLDVARISTGKLRLDRRTAELNSLLKTAAETCGPDRAASPYLDRAPFWDACAPRR